MIGAVEMTFLKALTNLGKGFGITCLLFVLIFISTLVFGLLLCLGHYSKAKLLAKIVDWLVMIIRGTPLLLQLIFFCYVPGIIFKDVSQDLLIKQLIATTYWKYIAVYIAFTLHYSCYFSEIYRGGFESVSKTLIEAGSVLGMKKRQITWYIVLPLVIKNILPALSNETLTLVKDTSLAATLGVFELYANAQQLVKNNLLLWPLIAAGLFYFLFNTLVAKLFRLVEKKLSYYKL